MNNNKYLVLNLMVSLILVMMLGSAFVTIGRYKNYIEKSKLINSPFHFIYVDAAEKFDKIHFFESHHLAVINILEKLHLDPIMEMDVFYPSVNGKKFNKYLNIQMGSIVSSADYTEFLSRDNIPAIFKHRIVEEPIAMRMAFPTSLVKSLFKGGKSFLNYYYKIKSELSLDTDHYMHLYPTPNQMSYELFKVELLIPSI